MESTEREQGWHSKEFVEDLQRLIAKLRQDNEQLKAHNNFLSQGISTLRDEVDHLKDYHEIEIQGYIKRQRDGFNEAQLHYGEYRNEITHLKLLVEAGEKVMQTLAIWLDEDCDSPLHMYDTLKNNLEEYNALKQTIQNGKQDDNSSFVR